jgi:hypothetical protein
MLRYPCPLEMDIGGADWPKRNCIECELEAHQLSDSILGRVYGMMETTRDIAWSRRKLQ